MSFLSDVAEFMGFGNPAEAASPYLEKIPGEIKGYYDPYIQAGQGQIPGLEAQYGQLMQDPGQKLASMGAGFQQSPGFDFAQQNAIRAATQAAAAGGMAGSPANQFDVAGLATNMANQDYYNYLDRTMGLYGQGLQGSQGMATQGLQAGMSLADQLANVAGSQANLAFAGQQAQNQAAGGVLGGITSLAGAGLGMIPFGGGGGAPGAGSFGGGLTMPAQGGTFGQGFGGFM